MVIVDIQNLFIYSHIQKCTIK